MGFMDKAKEAAEDLKASFATTEVRDSEQAYRDLGMIAYLTTTGRPIDEADRQRLVNTLWALEQQAEAAAVPAGDIAAPTAATPAAGSGRARSTADTGATSGSRSTPEPPAPAAPPVPPTPSTPAAPTEQPPA